MIQLKNGDITCYFQKIYDKFCLEGISLEREPNRIYTRNSYGGFDDMSLEYINLESFITDKLNRIVRLQVEAYVRAHANRYDIYKLTDDNGRNSFYQKSLNDPGMTVKDPAYQLSFDNLISGIVSVSINGTEYEYDLRLQEFHADKPLVYLLYKDSLDRLIAKEQLRIGSAPQALTELNRLNKALRDKQTVTFVFKDGDTKTLRRSYFDVSDVFYLTIGENEITCRPNGCYESQSIDDIDYMKLGKVKFHFYPERMKNLSCPVVLEPAV